jgi:uncharacterized protein with GYD domain
MATDFIGLNFTGKAFEKIKEVPSRVEAARKMFRQSARRSGRTTWPWAATTTP